MPYLKLTVTSLGRPFEFRDGPVRLGRDPTAPLSFSGEEARVVSSRHAEIRLADGAWRLADVGSRNGTWLNGERLTAEATLKPGDQFSLGERGPRIVVDAVAEVSEATILEHPGFAAADGPPARPPSPRPYGITLVVEATGKRFQATGSRMRIGRGSECEIRPVDAGDKTVSRVHSELIAGPSGALTVRDAGSRNGTLLNGSPVTGPVPVKLGDRVQLGASGPVLVIEGLGTAPSVPAIARPAPSSSPGMGQHTVMGLINNALEKAKEERKRGGRGSTAFMRAVVNEVGQDSRRKIRWLTTAIVALVLLLAGGVYGVYWLLSAQVQLSEEAQRTIADSSRSESQAELERLRHELSDARASAAPAAVVESLRTQLESAQVRTTELQAALERAQSALTQQLAAGEAKRAQAQQDLERLRVQLAEAERRSTPSAAALDSLRRAVANAEHETAALDTRLRAVRGTDFASIAQQDQGAVGLITVAFGREYFNGTGFVISPDGYMLTNWHVVADSAHEQPDTTWVTMADQGVPHLADVVITSRERDIALIKIRGYQGPSLTAVDWSGAKTRQGEPAALIGYPAGAGFARLRSSVVRTSMTAGIISRANEDVIQFDGMTIGGSSGSPVFNANGEVIAIHRAGLPQAPGFALSVPVRHAVAILPPALKTQLGIQ